MSNFSFQEPVLLTLIPVMIVLLVLILRRNFIRFHSPDDKKKFVRENRRTRIFLFATRTIIFTLLIIALAGPTTIVNKTVAGNPVLHIFVDESRSFELFDTSAVTQVRDDVQRQIPVSMRTIASGDSSRIGDGLLANMEGDNNILLVSDGHNTDGRSLGDMLYFASQLNVTINLLNTPLQHADAVVWIEGPDETTRDIANTFVVKVQTAGAVPEYQLVLTVDGQTVLTETHTKSVEIPFEEAFTEGYHRITAEIQLDDHVADNNKYYKSVKVEPKPRVLLVSQQDSPLRNILGDLYELQTNTEVPATLSSYSAVVLNNMPASALPVDRLAAYAADGNGIVVVGGPNAYDKGGYSRAEIESILPAYVGTGAEGEQRSDVNLVILIDISGTAGIFYDLKAGVTVEDVEKALAVQIIDDLSPDSKVGVIAFSNKPTIIGNLAPVSQQKDLLVDIERLTFGGGTVIEDALTAARDMLLASEGSKNIILISDGLGGNPAEELRQVRLNNLRGITQYSVGVGPHTNTQHMQDLSNLGNGLYFEPSQAEKIRLLLGEPRPDEDDVYRLEILDDADFITRNLGLSAVINGLNFVVPKTNAKTLLTTSQGHPIVTSWRFGLGRIIAFSTDDGSGWSSQLLTRSNSQLHSRMVNWAVGDLSRNKVFDIKMKDTHLGESLPITVISDKVPTHPDLSFVQTGDNLYLSSTTPTEQGFQQYLDGLVGVNYPLELSHVGIDPALSELVAITNGNVFEASEADAIVEKVRTTSRKSQTTSQSYRTPLAIAALAIFLLEILARKLRENRNLNK